MDVIEYLESKNFQYIGNMFDDFFIRKDLLDVKYNIDYESARENFPLFSMEKKMETVSILNKFTGHGSAQVYNMVEEGDMCVWNQKVDFLQSFFKSIANSFFICPSSVK